MSIEDENLELDEEYSEISKVLQNQHPNVLLLDHVRDINAQNLHNKLNFEVGELAEDQKLIVQIGGHSDNFGLFLDGAATDEKGIPKVCPESAKKYFSKFENKIECVIFSSCKSVELASKVYEVNNINGAIGLTKYIDSKTSIAFSKNFYYKLLHSLDLFSSYEYAKNFMILKNEDGVFSGHIKKQNPKTVYEQLLLESEQPNTKRVQLIQLLDLFKDIQDINSHNSIDISLYQKVKKIILKIGESQYGFESHFEHFSELAPTDNIAPKEKIIIFKWKKRVIFEFGIIISSKILELIFEESYPESIPAVLNRLISDYKLKDRIEFKYSDDLNKADKILLLQEKADGIKSMLEKLRNEEVEAADFYKKIFDFVDILTANKFVQIEKDVKYRAKAGHNMEDLLSYIVGMKNYHSKCHDEMISIIPFNL